MFMLVTCTVSDDGYVITDPIIVNFAVKALRGLLRRSTFRAGRCSLSKPERRESFHSPMRLGARKQNGFVPNRPSIGLLTCRPDRSPRGHTRGPIDQCGMLRTRDSLPLTHAHPGAFVDLPRSRTAAAASGRSQCTTEASSHQSRSLGIAAL